MNRSQQMISKVVNAAIARGSLVVVNVPARASTLAEACALRGLDPQSYRTPHQRFGNRMSAHDRVIPGVPDNKAPGDWCAKNLGANYHGNARLRYTQGAAANDRAQIAEGGVEAYVAAFVRLNNLT